MIKTLIKNPNYIQPTLSEYYCDLDDLKKEDKRNLEYWSEYQCKVPSLKTYFKTQLDFKIRYIISVFEIPDHYYIEFRNYVPIGGKLTQEFVIWCEDDDNDVYSYVCIPKNQSNDGINNKSSLTIFKNGMDYKEYNDVNFLEMKQQINKDILGKDKDKRYFNRQYKKHKAKEKLGVYHKKSKKTMKKLKDIKERLNG